MSPDDATLLQRWTAQRDAEAFNAIVDRFADQVYATCRRILRNDADAEDVSQECFLLLVRAGGDVRASLGGWLHRAATTRSLDRIRRDASRRAREQAYGEAGDGAVEAADAGWTEMQRHIDEAIEALPEELRNAVVAHFIERKSHAEIAAEVGVSRRAVTYRIERGLEAIRRTLRRRGVTVAVASIGTSLAADVSAAPLSLKATLGKLAIAVGTVPGAGGATATGSLLGSLVLMKAKISVLTATLFLIVLGVYVASTRNNLHLGLPVPEAAELIEGPVDVGMSPETIAALASETLPVTSPEPSNGGASIEELLALSRVELEKELRFYAPIMDSADFASISGTVMDLNGYPISGANILLTPSIIWGKLPGAAGMSYSASTGSDGAYRIDGIRDSGPYWVTASSGGYASEARGRTADRSIEIEAGKRVGYIDFKLTAGPSIHGRVLSASGVPVPEALVYSMGVAGANGAFRIDSRHAARTGAAGYFHLGFAEKDRGNVVALRVTSKDQGSATFPYVVIQDETPVELRLTPGSMIHGTIQTTSGKPPSGARLTFWGSNPSTGANRDDPFEAPFAGNFYTRCDDRGRFALEVDAGLDYGVETMLEDRRTIKKRGHVSALKPGESREYNAIVDTDLIVVHATVVGQQSGKPFSAYIPTVAGAMRDGVEVAYGDMGEGNVIQIILPEAGEYTFQARYTIDWNVRGDVSAPYELASGRVIEVALNLPDPQTFSVRAVDASGNPVAGAAVNLLTATTGNFSSGHRTNADGALDRILLMPPNCGAQVWLEKPGYAPGWGARFEDQGPGIVHPEETIVLRAGAGFEGDLLDGQGRPLENTALTITATNGQGEVWSIPVSTDANGHFTVVDLAPADVVDIAITTRDGSGAWEARQVELVANSITGLGRIRLE